MYDHFTKQFAGKDAFAIAVSVHTGASTSAHFAAVEYTPFCRISPFIFIRSNVDSKAIDCIAARRFTYIKHISRVARHATSLDEREILNILLAKQTYGMGNQLFALVALTQL